MLPSCKVLDVMDQDSSLLVVGGVSSSTSTTTEAEANDCNDVPSRPPGDYFHKVGDYFAVHRSFNLSHRSFNLSQVSALSTGSYRKDLAVQAEHEIQPHKSLQSALIGRRLPVEDDFDSDDEESKAPDPKAILSLPKRSSDATLEPIAYHFKSTSTDVSQDSSSKGRSEQLQVRAMLENSPPADQRKGSKKEKFSPVKRKGSNKMKKLPDHSTAFEVVIENSKQKQPKQKKDPPESVEETQQRQQHSKRSIKAVEQVDGEIISNKDSNERLRSCSVTVDTELTHRLSHSSRSTGGEEEAHIAHHIPKLHADHQRNNKNGWSQSVREKMGETRQGKNPPPPPCRDIFVSSPPLQMRPKMLIRSLSVGNMMMNNLDDNDLENNNHNNNSDEVDDGKGAAKPLSVRRLLVAANPPRDFTRPYLETSYGGSLSFQDVTTTRPSFDTMKSPQRLRRGKKPGTKHIPSSPLATITPRLPTNRRDYRCDPKKNKDARHRSASCDQPLDRRPISLSSSKLMHEHLSTRSIPQEIEVMDIRDYFSTRSIPRKIEVMESSGPDDRKAAMARSRSPRTSARDSSRRGSTERDSGRLDLPSFSPRHRHLKRPSSSSTLQSLRSTSTPRVRTAGFYSPQHRSQHMRLPCMDANKRPPRADPILKTPSREERKPSLPVALTQLYIPSIHEILPTGRRSSTRQSSRRRCRSQSKPSDEVM